MTMITIERSHQFLPIPTMTKIKMTMEGEMETTTVDALVLMEASKTDLNLTDTRMVIKTSNLTATPTATSVPTKSKNCTNQHL
jgi:hypothetical protein